MKRAANATDGGLVCRHPFHAGCEHPGWHQVKPEAVGRLLGAARAAADIAGARLGLERVRLLFFGPGPCVRVNPEGQQPIDRLNRGPHDPTLKGSICDPDFVQPLTIWLSASLSPLAVQWVASHEIRHLWQLRQGFEGDGEEDADAFAWQLLAERLLRPALSRVAKELNFSTGASDD